MATTIKHRNTNIVILGPDETIIEYCGPGDIAIVQDQDGWWTHFINMEGDIDSYDEPFESYNKALWTAKAAAEFDAE